MAPPADEGAQQPPASTSGRVSQRDLPYMPGTYNKRDATAPCAALHVDLLKCYKNASALSFGPCREEYDAFWACMRHHRPPHKEPRGGSMWPYLRDEAWPQVKRNASQMWELLAAGLRGGSGGGSGGGGGGGGKPGG